MLLLKCVNSNANELQTTQRKQHCNKIQEALNSNEIKTPIASSAFFPARLPWLSTQSKCGSQDALCQSTWQSQREFYTAWAMKDCIWQWHSQLWEAKRKTACVWMHTRVATPTRDLHAWTHSWQSQRESQKTNFTLQTRTATPMLRKCTCISAFTASS